MKVSGAVAMADDPEHAFGMYFEKIDAHNAIGAVAGAPGCEARTEQSVSARSPSAAPALILFDADPFEDVDSFSLSRDIAYIKNSSEFRYNLRLAHKLNLIDELLKPDAP